MSAQWHYELFGEEFGPVAEETLQELIAKGTLSEEDRVRTNGGPWLTAAEALLMANMSATATAVVPEPKLDDDPADADDIPEWYCQVLGQELGPLAFNELLNFAQSGELSADDQVRLGATGKWRRVGSMGRLVSVLPYQNSSVTRVGKKKPAATAPAEPQTPSSPPVKPAAPQITYAPAASEPTWFAWIRGMEYGPLSLLQLQQYLSSGQLSPTDFVKFGMTGAWCPPVTVTQMLAQYVMTLPPTPSRTPTPPNAIPTVTTVPAAKQPSVENVATVPAAKPTTAASKTEITPPITKPAAAAPVAKVEPPRTESVTVPAQEPVTRPAPVTTSSSASMNSYSSSATSNWQAKTVTAPPKPVAKPARSSGGGMSFDFSAITSMMDAKTLGIGGGVIAAAALVVAFMYMPAGSGAEAKAFNELQPLYAEFKKIRENKGGPAELTALDAKIKKACPPIVALMEPRASASRPVSQKLLWVAKYRMNEMLAKGVATRSQSEMDCERMLYEVSKSLQLPMDAPKPAEEVAPKGPVNPNMNVGT